MRGKLSDKCPEQREAICKQIISILNLNDDNIFLLCDLDADLEKQRQLLDLKEDIKKYFACSTISTFKPNFECKRPYLNIVRSILRQQAYNVTSESFWLKTADGTFRRTMKFKIGCDK
jgi:hypothetical protein